MLDKIKKELDNSKPYQISDKDFEKEYIRLYGKR